MPKTVHFTTLGCKVNQYDTQAMLEKFEKHGYVSAQPGTAADVYVVNTCTVTGTGDKKSLQIIRRCARRNPQAELVITGCLAQRMGEKLRDTGARLILGTQYRANVVELLEKAIAENTQIVAVDNVEGIPYEPLMIHNHEGHTRAVMKIQEGCDNHCTYCIIPSVRGTIRSRGLEAIREEAEALAKAGFQELVLTGIHLTSYGRDLEGRPPLAEGVKAACVDGITRIRLGSLEPRVATEAFVDELSKLPQICPQFHLALQSGSDSVLRRMKRGYNTAQFLAAAERIRKAWPDAAFTTDVIVGFPGETEEEFEETLRFSREIGFARMHVFPFSPRETTPAAEMPDQIPEAVKAERVKRLIALGDELAQKYHEGFLGRTVPVLLEERLEDGSMVGYTPEYIHVRVPEGESGKVVNVRLTAIEGDGMLGECIKDGESEESFMHDCLFCKIMAGEIPSKKVYEDEFTYAFHDIAPQAQTHVLVISKKHTPDVAHNADLSDQELAACLRTCAKVAEMLGLTEGGYRIVNNCGDNACQTVKHMHYHVLGGEKLSEKMA